MGLDGTEGEWVKKMWWEDGRGGWERCMGSIVLKGRGVLRGWVEGTDHVMGARWEVDVMWRRDEGEEQGGGGRKGGGEGENWLLKRLKLHGFALFTLFQNKMTEMTIQHHLSFPCFSAPSLSSYLLDQSIHFLIVLSI